MLKMLYFHMIDYYCFSSLLLIFIIFLSRDESELEEKQIGTAFAAATNKLDQDNEMCVPINTLYLYHTCTFLVILVSLLRNK